MLDLEKLEGLVKIMEDSSLREGRGGILRGKYGG